MTNYFKQLSEAFEQIDKQSIAEIAKLVNLAGKKQRIVCTGVGKSGQVAKKLADSLSSIGYDAIFVDAVWAMHGDLGRVPHRSIVIAVSNSMKSPEIGAFVDWVIQTRNGVKVRYITSNAAYAGKGVIHPSFDRIVPTSSLSLSATITDAIVHEIVSYFDDKELRRVFAHNHPGGALGKQLQGVK